MAARLAALHAADRPVGVDDVDLPVVTLVVERVRIIAALIAGLGESPIREPDDLRTGRSVKAPSARRSATATVGLLEAVDDRTTSPSAHVASCSYHPASPGRSGFHHRLGERKEAVVAAVGAGRGATHHVICPGACAVGREQPEEEQGARNKDRLPCHHPSVESEDASSATRSCGVPHEQYDTSLHRAVAMLQHESAQFAASRSIPVGRAGALACLFAGTMSKLPQRNQGRREQVTTANATRAARDAASARARVEHVLREHRATLVRVARRWSGSADDAEDVVQRALEIYLRRLDDIDPATELAWLRVVVRNEALAVRRARAEAIPLDGNDLETQSPSCGMAVDERIEQVERNARSLEALVRLKPDERAALLLKAEGFSYREIAERNGWTYTKVNRAVTEGRRRFRDVIARIDDGSECERYATDVARARGGQRAVARIDRRAPPASPSLRVLPGDGTRAACVASASVPCCTCHSSPASRRRAGRWALVDAHGPAASGAGPDLKASIHGLLNRLQGPDVATSVQMASGGGGRGPAVAALLGLCLGGGAGTYCLTSGAIPDPVRILRPEETEAPKRERARKPAEPSRSERRCQPLRPRRSAVLWWSPRRHRRRMRRARHPRRRSV